MPTITHTHLNSTFVNKFPSSHTALSETHTTRQSVISLCIFKDLIFGEWFTLLN